MMGYALSPQNEASGMHRELAGGGRGGGGGGTIHLNLYNTDRPRTGVHLIVAAGFNGILDADERRQGGGGGRNNTPQPIQHR